MFTGPTRLINTTDMPPVVFFIASPMFFITNSSSKSRREKSQEKSRPKKAGPEAPANPYKKPVQNSKQQRGPQNGAALKRRPIFGPVVMNFESVS